MIEHFNPLEGKFLQILDKEGNVDKLLEPKLSVADLKKMYECMVLTRMADDKGLKLQRSGRMGTFAQVLGQEAQVAVGFAMQKQDWFFPSFRELGILLAREAPLESFYLTFMGCEEGNRTPKNINNFPVSVPVGSQTLHGVGAAMAAKIKNHKVVTVVALGDGGTSEGDFHEAMNFAGVFKAPCIIFCQNNQWAISTPRNIQTASKTIAQKAIAYGFPGIQVDGNDALALYAATKEAIENARKGKGPTLIESLTYRIGPHTTADDPTLYRSEKEVKYWQDRDPIKRFKIYLQKKGLWNKKYEDDLVKKCTKQIEEAVAKAGKIAAATKPEDMFKYMYAEMTPELKEQFEYLQENLEVKEE
ncbi:MAG: pyruvate dehydrogenase (acetyl-transferring) E1 component subunit alpha [Candidatus Woesearchaeota archaeon]|nr:pyruvate dehydrogenase (acetyl-transferring) E1 component subunit alpha [Candidatus Woesearchaeota archaeon]